MNSILDVKLNGIPHTYELVAINLVTNTALLLEPRNKVSNNGSTWGYDGHNLISVVGKQVKHLIAIFEADSLGVMVGVTYITIDDVINMQDVTYLKKIKGGITLNELRAKLGFKNEAAAIILG